MESEQSEATAQDFRALLEYVNSRNKEHEKMRRLGEHLSRIGGIVQAHDEAEEKLKGRLSIKLCL